MTLPEFMTQLNNLIAEIGTERVNSHYSLIPSLYIMNDEGEAHEITSLEPHLLPGCGCWSGVIIYLKKDKH